MAARLPSAILFDLDGTLVDTEPYWFEAECEVVAQHGGTWTLEDAHTLVGNALLVSAREILSRTSIEMEPAALVELLLDGVIARVRERVPWRPGAFELLTSCAEAGVPTALVTMSYQRLVDELLRSLPEGIFDVIVTGDMVEHGKPHPEPYLVAASRLGVSPHDCLAIEDSRTGVASARGAGVPTVGIPYLHPIPEEPGLVLVPTLEGTTAESLQALFD